MSVPATQDRTSSPTGWIPDRFIPLPENRSALLAVRRLAYRLARHRPIGAQPLVLVGPPGVGKTLLLTGLESRFQELRTVRRLPAADWPSADEAFSIRRVDLLLIDDLHHLPDWAIESLAGTLDERSSRRLPAVITSSTRPASLAFPARVTNRLAAGLIVALSPYGSASRRRLIEAWCAEQGFTISDEVRHWLAQMRLGSARQLRAALDRAVALGPCTFAELQEQFEVEVSISPVTLTRIARTVARTYGVDEKALASLDRRPGIRHPRQICMYLGRTLTNTTLMEIGAYFGRDHTTVHHACQKIETMMAADPELLTQIRQIETELR